MNTNQQGQSEQEKTRLLEIYKIHVQAVSDLNNRVTTTNRYFYLMIAGLFVILFGFIQDIGVISVKKAPDEVELGRFYTVIGCLGIYVSLTWGVFIDSSHKILSGKYKALKKLEEKLDFQFINHEWEYLSKNNKNITYQDLYVKDFFAPFATLMMFSVFFLQWMIHHEDRLYLLFLIMPMGFIILFLVFLIKSIWRTRVK